MIRMSINKETLETGMGLDSVVKRILWYQVFYKDAIGKSIASIKTQRDMYYSSEENPYIFKKIKLNLFHNLVKPLCDTATTTFLSRVPDIVSKGTDAEKSRISKFSLKQKHNDFEEEIDDVALQCSITGSGFLCLYNEIGDTFPHYRSLDPVYANVVYDCTVAMRKLCAYNIYLDVDDLGNARWVCIVYTKNKMYSFYSPKTSIPTTYMAISVFPLNLFLINNTEPSNVVEHGYKDIPIIEFINNKYCKSDCGPAITLILLYSALQNNRFQNVEDILNYLLFIKNARLGDEEEAKKAVELIKRHKVLPLEGEDVDAKFLTNPLNQTDVQKLADAFKNEIHYILHIPDFTSTEFTQNASDPILKAKTKPLLDLCKRKEKWFNKGYMQMLDLTLDYVERYGGNEYAKIKFDLDNIDLVYSHALPSNDIDTTNMIVNLNNAKLGAPRVLLQGLSAIPNVDDYIKEMKEHNEYLIDIANKTNNNNGVNDTNIARQNEKPTTKDQMDNKNNFIKGQAQDIVKW